MPPDRNKDDQSCIGLFIEWLDHYGAAWFQADLAAYRDYLLKPHQISIKRGDQRCQAG
jgi:hypothetical protein